MNDTHKPDDLHDEQLSRLYRQSRIEEPPMGLDSAILQRARRATEKKSGWPWLRRFWIAPLATAAVALLTVSVVIQMKQQHPEALTPTVQSELPAAQENEALQEGFANKQAPVLEKRKVAPTAPTTAPTAGQATAPMLHRQAPAPAPSPAQSKAQPKKELKAAEPARAFDMESRELGNQRKAASDSISESALPPAPEMWLKQIQALLEAGKKAEATAELAKFIEQYPDYPLPKELHSLQKEQATPPAQ